MRNITDDDLTLLYYGEVEDPALVAKIAGSPELTARFEALSAELDRVNQFEPPMRSEDYGSDVWQKISPRLEAEKKGLFSRWRTLLPAFTQPSFSMTGAFSLALVAALAFMLGRQASQPGEPAPQLAEENSVVELAGFDAERLLTSSISGHLDQLNLVFTQFANTPEPVNTDAERATDLLVANRLYRSAAMARGNQKLAKFLAGLEPLLIELAHEAYKASPATRDRMQQEVRDKLLFRVRVVNKQLDQSRIST
jgi:hypothetical protein